MRPMVPAFVLASSLVALLPSGATAQCEGGTWVAGYYLGSGSYVGGGCRYTILTPPHTTDLGAAPSLVNQPAGIAGPQPSGSTVGPGVNRLSDQTTALGATGGLSDASTASLGPGQLPPSGAPALTGNRAVPSGTLSWGVTSPLSTAVDPSGVYGSSLPAAPVPAEEPDPGEPPAPGRGGSTLIGH